MLNQQSLDDLINFIKLNNHGLWKVTGDGYAQTFCHYCNDYGRKSNPDHGHGNVAFNNLFYKCWRCDISKSLLQYLLDQGYSNQDVIGELKSLKQSGYVYRGIKRNTYNSSDSNLKYHLKNKYFKFKKEHPEKFDQFLDYVSFRCGDINPIKFGFSPLIKKNKLLIEFHNSSGKSITARFIDENKIRYIKYKDSGYYHFQPIENVMKYKNIIISEGIFDIVNLSNYYSRFKNSFFFAMNNRNYKSTLRYLLGRYFLIGNYRFHIVFDSDVWNIRNTKSSLLEIKNQLNPECKLNFYKPDISKDVSELMSLKEGI